MYTYRLTINKYLPKGFFTFNYGHSRNIVINISKNAASIQKDLKKDYRDNLMESYLINLMKEGMKRAALLHLLMYQEPMKVKKVVLEVLEGEKVESNFDLTEEMVLYSLITTRLERPISKEWNDKIVLRNILQFMKSTDDMARQISALYAYLYSKTKRYETERFSYLWMAMNGLYASLHPETGANDTEGLKALLKRFGLGEELFSRKERTDKGLKAMLKLKDAGEPITRDSLMNGKHQELAVSIKSLLTREETPLNLTPYGYLLTDFPYYLRCKFFHANRPMELFSFQSDMELKAIRIANGLLEEFLDENLVMLFK